MTMRTALCSQLQRGRALSSGGTNTFETDLRLFPCSQLPNNAPPGEALAHQHHDPSHLDHALVTRPARPPPRPPIATVSRLAHGLPPVPSHQRAHPPRCAVLPSPFSLARSTHARLSPAVDPGLRTTTTTTRRRRRRHRNRRSRTNTGGELASGATSEQLHVKRDDRHQSPRILILLLLVLLILHGIHVPPTFLRQPPPLDSPPPSRNPRRTPRFEREWKDGERRFDDSRLVRPE